MSSVVTGTLGSNTPTNRFNAQLTTTNNTWSFAEGPNDNIISVSYRHFLDGYESSDGSSGSADGSWSTGDTGLEADTTHTAKAKAIFTYWKWTGSYYVQSSVTKTGYQKSKKLQALIATASTPTYSNVLITTADIACNYVPNVTDSTSSAQLQYKKNSDSTWINAGTPNAGGGYATLSATASLTGLSGNTVYNVRLVITRTTTTNTSVVSATASFTTQPDTPTLTAETATNITSSGAQLNGTVNPQGFTTDVYIDWGSSSGVYPNAVFIAQYSDSTLHNVSTTISGLTPSTTYYYRTRGMVGATEYDSTEKSFTTAAPPPIPDVTTDAASSIGQTAATMNGTVNPNAQSTTYFFEWGTTPSYGNTTASQGPDSGTSPIAFNAQITGLTANTTYHFRAVANYAGGDVYGSDAQFTTQNTPAGNALEEEHTGFMALDGKKNQSAIFTFPLYSPQQVVQNSDNFYTGTAPTNAEVKVFQGGGSGASITTAPSTVGNGLYKITLTAAEMNANLVDVIIKSATTAFREVYLRIRTVAETGQLDIDSTNGPTNADAFKLTSSTGKSINASHDLYTAGKLDIVGNAPIGAMPITGNLTAAAMSLTGALAVGSNLTVAGAMTITGALGAASITGVFGGESVRSGTCQTGDSGSVTLDASAASISDFYNGQTIIILSGKGLGQCRQIVDYDGVSKRCSVHKGWLDNPDATSTFLIIPGEDTLGFSFGEISSIPLKGDTTGSKIQALYQRFFFRREHKRPNPAVAANTSQKLYKSDGTSLGTGQNVDAGLTASTLTFTPDWSL